MMEPQIIEAENYVKARCERLNALCIRGGYNAYIEARAIIKELKDIGIDVLAPAGAR